MNKRLLIAAAGGAAGLILVRRAKAHCSKMDFGEMIERMPDDAPPKWMFRNISAIRDNTERILELLATEREAPTAAAAEPMAGIPTG